MLVGENEAARVRAHADVLETESRRRADAAGAVERAVGAQLRLAAEPDDRAAVLVREIGDVGVEVDRDAEPRRHLLAQRVAELRVEVREQPRAIRQQRDPNAERGEDARVLAADRAAADDDHRRRNPLQREQ